MDGWMDGWVYGSEWVRTEGGLRLSTEVFLGMFALLLVNLNGRIVHRRALAVNKARVGRSTCHSSWKSIR